ncbi:heparinase II/III-family protein [Paenibacillus doosanensis]|uniref:heparinase II/III-family protein n=1 Tax=Paenibacillus doosanensis TaxID=1229154 RepID=UPI0021803B2C|nr:heparinase II/III-family protein [Paenibacillus doosanensis]MCS7458622.1 heparinase II/III-family protein [Paenibacillus doosanensis]
MIRRQLNLHDWKRRLLGKEEYKPFPRLEEREPWEQLPASLKASIVREAEASLPFAYPPLTAVMYMEFWRNGNRTRYDLPYHRRRRALTTFVLAECIENKGRFLDDIVNGIWCICEETSWVISAHNFHFYDRSLPVADKARHDIDLFAAETGNALAWTYYLLGDALTEHYGPLVKERLAMELRERILEPYASRTDMWWMGFDESVKLYNWTTWITSNVLSAVLFVEEDDDRRIRAVEKAAYSLDRFLLTYHADGGCDEGPSYWNKAAGSLFDCLEQLFVATGGTIDLYGEPLIRNIAAYIFKAHIHDRYVLNFADGPHKVTIEGDLIYRFGSRTGQSDLMDLGYTIARRWGTEGVKQMQFFSFLRVVPALFNFSKLLEHGRAAAYPRSLWLEGIQVMIAREAASPEQGLYVAVKGGHNDESHNHNDVGQFVIYYDGEPCIIDLGVETYTKETFGPNRYDIWTMQSSYHNLPEIAGVRQGAGEGYRASDCRFADDGQTTSLELDIAGAYPPEAGLDYWHRSVALLRGGTPAVQVTETYRFASEAGEIALHLLTGREPGLQADGTIWLPTTEGKGLVCQYDNRELEAVIEARVITDEKLLQAWGETVYRIVMKPKERCAAGQYVFTFRA